MKILKVALQCLATHTAYIKVNDNCSLEDAIKVAKTQIDHMAPAENLQYVADSNQICEEECKFVTKQDSDIQRQVDYNKFCRNIWKEHVIRDIRSFLEKHDMKLDDERIDKAATLCVMPGESYWSNIENVIKSVM